jgi:hypothetical protein
MKRLLKHKKRWLTLLSMGIVFCVQGQTEIDGLFMQKKFFCTGVTAGYSSWKHYWEGTNKRNNDNLGTVSTTHAALMGNYGISGKLNLLFGIPYVKTKAGAGQLAGQSGVQDLSLFAKWNAREFNLGHQQTLRAILVAGVSTPVTNYTPDLLPLSIGLKCKMASLRGMIDYERGDWFATASYAYVLRGNVKLDRESYYTTSLHYTNEVFMPDVSNINLRAGYRTEDWIVEAIFDQRNTLGGFDISKNNMPFVSNKMNATSLGLHVKYETAFLDGLSIVADASTVVNGRNVGQASAFGGGFFYIMDFGHKKSKSHSSNPSK